MSSWRGKRRGQSSPSDAQHTQPHSHNHSPSPPQTTKQQQQQQQRYQPTAPAAPAPAPPAQPEPATAAPPSPAAPDNDGAAAVGGNKSILNEVLAFMQQAQPPQDAPTHIQQQPPPHPAQPQQQPSQPQFPQPIPASTPQHGPSPQHTQQPHPRPPAFQPPTPQPTYAPIQPPPGFARPLPPPSQPQPQPQPLQPFQPLPPHMHHMAGPAPPLPFGAFSAFPGAAMTSGGGGPRLFPSPIAPPPGFGGVQQVRGGGVVMGGGGGFGPGPGLYSHFAPVQQPIVQPLPYPPSSPYGPPAHAPSMSPLARGMQQQQQQQQWVQSGGRLASGGGQLDMESLAAMQRLHLDDGSNAQQYQRQPPVASPPTMRTPATAPQQYAASPTHPSPHSQQPSAFLFQTPQRQPQQSTAAPASAAAAGAWGRKSGGQLFGASPASAQPSPHLANSPTGPPASPSLSGDGPPTPSTPATPSASTYVPYVPHPSALTQPIRPRLRRAFPALAHMPHSSHMDQQLNALLATLIPSVSSDAARDACRAQLEELVRHVWPTAAVRLFGSSVNLLCDERSDCDLSLLMGEETGVKQSCYNSVVPKPPKAKGKKAAGKDAETDSGAEPNGAATNKEQQLEDTLGTAQGAGEPDAPQQLQQQQPAATADNTSDATKPPGSPQANAKPSSSLTVDQLPTYSLSNPDHLQQLALTPPSPDQPPIEPGAVIEKLAAILKTESGTLYSGILALPKARVPIVKFHSDEYGYDGDIGINNLLAIENSQLIRAYMTADPRARQLVFVVKHWAKQRKINDPFRGTLSSYAYVLMTIHFLQQLTPPVLPCLQSYAARNRPQRLVGGYDCWWDARLAADWRSDNGSSLSALLSGWFMYYAHCFGFGDDVISVRVGGVLGKREKEREWAGSGKRDKHLLSIEDPFEVSHDLGRVCDGNALYEIRGECIRGIKMMMEGKSVQSIVARYEKEWRGS